jgi:hypothetical protein
MTEEYQRFPRQGTSKNFAFVYMKCLIFHSWRRKIWPVPVPFPTLTGILRTSFWSVSNLAMIFCPHPQVSSKFSKRSYFYLRWRQPNVWHTMDKTRSVSLLVVDHETLVRRPSNPVSLRRHPWATWHKLTVKSDLVLDDVWGLTRSLPLGLRQDGKNPDTSLLWIDKGRGKDKTYKRVSVWWKTKN